MAIFTLGVQESFKQIINNGGTGPDYKTATKKGVFDLDTVIRAPGQLILKPEDFEGRVLI